MWKNYVKEIVIRINKIYLKKILDMKKLQITLLDILKKYYF